MEKCDRGRRMKNKYDEGGDNFVGGCRKGKEF